MTDSSTSDRQDPVSAAIKPLPKVGQELGKFIIERELPRGGQARVFRAWQTDLSRTVALKVLPPSFATDVDALSRFRREVENVARISHPNIVRIFEAGELEGYPYFSMEYLDGDDCETLLRRGPMSPDDAASVMESIARAVSEAHRKGIVHRDIKPGNVIVKADQTPVLTDFGLAQDLTHSAQLTQTGVSMGTPAYMAPEQARGERDRVGKKSDIYALGATLFTLLTAKRPAEGASAYEIMLKVAEMQAPNWPRTALELVPADLRAIVEMAMQNDSAKRYESAEALAEDLARFLSGEWVTARSRTWLSKSWHRVRRYAAVAAVIVVSVGLSAGLIVSSMLDPAANTARPGALLPDKNIWPVDSGDSAGPETQSLVDRWSHEGSSVVRAVGSERTYIRAGEGNIKLAYNEPICWGDFELETLFSVVDARGEVSLIIGAPENAEKGEPAYRVVIGAQAANRFEIRRLGRPLVAGTLYQTGSPFAGSAAYRALVYRNGDSLRFELRSLPGDIPLAVAQLDDAYPALNAGRDRFAMEADARSLVVRGVSVRHRDSDYSRETVLFLEGNYASAKSPLAAKLAAPLDPAHRNERAYLHFMHGRCLENLATEDAQLEAALSEYSEAKRLATDSRLRARVFLKAAQVETSLGRDDNALIQLAAARNNAETQQDLSSQVHSQALALGQNLMHPGEPAKRISQARRALRYFDWVAQNILHDGYLVCEARFESARLRLELSATGSPDMREEALQGLRWIKNGNYQNFSRVYGPALALLFDLRRAEFELDPQLPSEKDTLAPANEMLELATRMSDASGNFLSRFGELHPALVRAAWLARMSGRDEQASALLNTCVSRGSGDDMLWAKAQILLASEERQLGSTDDRLGRWTKFAAELAPLARTVATDALIALAEFFIEPNTEQSRLRALTDWLRKNPIYWTADCDAERFVDYLVGIRQIGQKRAQASTQLEKTAAGVNAGMLRLLSRRVAAWLPKERPNG